MAQAAEEPKPVAQNRRARFDYFIEETVEAGIVLHGTEVKSLRTGKASINESYAGEISGELFLINANIPEYEQASKRLQHEIKRPRKLLVKRRELARLVASIKREGVTLVPMSVYFTDRGKAKVLIGVAKGKKQHDKRATIKDRDWKREKARTLRTNNKS